MRTRRTLAALACCAVAAPLGAATPALAAPTAAEGPGPVAVDVVADDAAVRLSPVGRYSSGVFGASAAEIVAHARSFMHPHGFRSLAISETRLGVTMKNLIGASA